jgi:thiosulfate/3-mercaptopyruvate sulfurtransferase
MRHICVRVIALLSVAFLATGAALAQAGTASSVPQSKLIQPADLVKALQAGGKKPVVLQIGPHMLFTQGHIAGAEYVGAASTPEGLEKLKGRAKTLKKTEAIVLYCGCCPWEHCPNVAPAYEELRKEGFSNVKVLYIASNFGADWVYKGYPTAKGD